MYLNQTFFYAFVSGILLAGEQNGTTRIFRARITPSLMLYYQILISSTYAHFQDWIVRLLTVLGERPRFSTSSISCCSRYQLRERVGHTADGFALPFSGHVHLADIHVFTQRFVFMFDRVYTTVGTRIHTSDQQYIHRCIHVPVFSSVPSAVRC